MGKRIRVAVLMGGTSVEHDVSVCSALNVLDALEGETDSAPLPVYLSPDGDWYFGHRPQAPSLETSPEDRVRSRPRSLAPAGTVAATDVLDRLRGDEVDVVFVALHGPGGEDGTVQGLLRVAGVPFTGSDVLASALAMDKVRTKRLLSVAGVPAAPHRVLTVDALAPDRSTETVELLASELGFPCVVKPVSGGSSFGIRIVTEASRLPAALEEAFGHDSRVLVEAFVKGTEVTCGVLGGGVEDSRPLPLTEIVPPADAFFDFHAKYTVGACEEITPARVEATVARQVQRLAVTAHDALGCEGMSRTDFIVGPEGPRVLETNTIPGLTRTSLLPQGAAAAGIDFAELIRGLLRSALARAERSHP